MAQTAVEWGADVVVISEPWSVLQNWHADPSGKAAIWITDRGIRSNDKIRTAGSAEGVVAVELDRVTILSCYFSPNIPYTDFELRLEGLEDILATTDTRRTLVMGDFNAKSPAWGSRKMDARGSATMELAGR
ncbi:uncharacterized protein LOC144477681, partial [Augochlora pura]